jgi:hypothetical protein
LCQNKPGKKVLLKLNRDRAEENITIDNKGAATERELVKEQITGVGSAIIEKIDETEGDARSGIPDHNTEVGEIRAGSGSY